MRDSLIRDVRYAWRTLRRAPLAAATIVVTVGLGLGLVAAVYMFGSALEQFFGTRYYVTLYLVSIVAAGLTQLAFNAVLGSPVPTLGASGGVYGLLLAFAIYFPQQRLALIFLPVPIPARIFVAGYALIELFLGVTGTQAGVAHFAHLGGMVGAFLMIQWRGGKPPFMRGRRR